MSTEISAAAIRFATAYRAAAEAHGRLRAYWREHGGGIEPDPDGGGAYGHRFMQCVQPRDHYGNDTTMCEICIDSQPLHAAYLTASRARGAALRSLLRMTRDER